MIRELLLAAGLVATGCSAAQALTTRTWISGKGVDQAGCGPIASPCRTLQFAHDNTSDGGEIDVLDPAGYGSVNITKSISIVNDGVGTAGVLAPPSGDAVNIDAGTNATVLLRGLTIEGAGVGRNGVVFASGGALTIDTCLVRGFTGASSTAGNGILLKPTAGLPNIIVSNTTISDNGYVGLYYLPQGVVGRLAIDRVMSSNNQYGFSLTTSAAGPLVRHQISMTDCRATHNSQRGIEHIGNAVATSVVNLRRCVTTQNGTGLYLRNASFVLDEVTSHGNANSGTPDLFVETGTVGTYKNNSIISAGGPGIASQTPLQPF